MAISLPIPHVIAQLVEQRTENPCVPGSIPGGTTKNRNRSISVAVFVFCVKMLIFVLYFKI